MRECALHKCLDGSAVHSQRKGHHRSRPVNSAIVRRIVFGLVGVVVSRLCQSQLVPNLVSLCVDRFFGLCVFLIQTLLSENFASKF